METSDQMRSCSKSVQESHLELLKRGTLSDVTFIVGPTRERIQCHQAFLVARSPVFEVMFSERWNQVNNKEIPLKDMDPKIFKKFLQFIYADTIVANVPEALELLQVAHTYDVQLLVTRCEELLLETEVSLNDAVDVFQAAQKYERTLLMSRAADLIAVSLSELQSHPSFLRMDKETVIFILQKRCLHMTEVDLFRMALKWAKNQSDLTLGQSLEDILPLIRFPTMTLEEFTTTVVPTGLLPQSTLVEIFTYFGTDAQTRKSMASTLKFNTQKRRLWDSGHYFELYSGDFDRKKTKLVQLGKLVDSLQISTCLTGTTPRGISGINFYCPARLVSAASSPASSASKEFSIVLKHERTGATRDGSYNNMTSTFSVKAEEGETTEVLFDDVFPLESNAHYRITVVETPLASTQLGASREDYYNVKVFGRTRISHITLNIINNSVVIKKKRKMEAQETVGDHSEHPQLICGISLEDL